MGPRRRFRPEPGDPHTTPRPYLVCASHGDRLPKRHYLADSVVLPVRSHAVGSSLAKWMWMPSCLVASSASAARPSTAPSSDNATRHELPLHRPSRRTEHEPRWCPAGHTHGGRLASRPTPPHESPRAVRASGRAGSLMTRWRGAAPVQPRPAPWVRSVHWRLVMSQRCASAHPGSRALVLALGASAGAGS